MGRDRTERPLWVGASASLGAWSKPPNIGGFKLLALCNFAATPAAEREAAASRIVEDGCAAFSSWGPGCEQFHDEVDSWDIELGPSSRDSGMIILTTWHHSWTIEDTVHYFLGLEPIDQLRSLCEASHILSVGSDEWTRRVLAHEYVRSNMS